MIRNRFIVICSGDGLNPRHSHHKKLEIGRQYLAERINDDDSFSIRDLNDDWIGFYSKSHFYTQREYNLQKLLNAPNTEDKTDEAQ